MESPECEHFPDSLHYSWIYSILFLFSSKLFKNILHFLLRSILHYSKLFNIILRIVLVTLLQKYTPHYWSVLRCQSPFHVLQAWHWGGQEHGMITVSTGRFNCNLGSFPISVCVTLRDAWRFWIRRIHDSNMSRIPNPHGFRKITLMKN